LIITCLIRYDNLKKAAKIIGLYIFFGIVFVGIGGYLVIFVIYGGHVEFRPMKGSVGPFNM